ncbi:MAG: DNA replication/repair protein RecF [Chlorobia bacterium]|nr:DNA replication/repair protein RecF [Fimbriimonadaceae bacterium]
MIDDLKNTETVESVSPGKVSSVSLSDFRNYSEQAVELGQGFNIISGQNAQGKTNFLEALYLLATTRLLRGKRDQEAIREGKDRAVVAATLSGTRTELSFVLERGSKKKALLNGLVLPRASDVIGRLRCVCVSAADMEIVRGDPAERRLFLDLELSALSPAYLRHLTLYRRAVEQRNALLRDSRERHNPPEAFEVWEDQIAQHGAEIRTSRTKYVDDLAPFALEVHREMGAGEAIGLQYKVQDEAGSYELLLESLASRRGVDIARGSTGVGPHRDELEISVDSLEARLFGSQGQQRTAVIALKMATLALIQDREGTPPLLLLDDILSDLDQHRRAHLVKIVLSKAGQAVLTCTEASAAGDEILSRAKLFKVTQGSIKEL